uniref:IPT/TIG domain-containing protein n=1 Tax=Steinernema glaseri TaxID=37863 RepID=A0A1I7YSR2_9BILA
MDRTYLFAANINGHRFPECRKISIAGGGTVRLFAEVIESAAVLNPAAPLVPIASSLSVSLLKLTRSVRFSENNAASISGDYPIAVTVAEQLPPTSSVRFVFRELTRPVGDCQVGAVSE